MFFPHRLLTESRFENEKDVFNAISSLHEKGVATIITKSVIFDQKDANIITIIVSTGETRKKIRVPRLPFYFSGTGDLFAALTVAWNALGYDAFKACENAVCAIEVFISPLFHRSLISSSFIF